MARSRQKCKFSPLHWVLMVRLSFCSYLLILLYFNTSMIFTYYIILYSTYKSFKLLFFPSQRKNITRILKKVGSQRPRFMPKVLNKHHQTCGQKTRLKNAFALKIVLVFKLCIQVNDDGNGGKEHSFFQYRNHQTNWQKKIISRFYRLQNYDS